MVQNFKVSLSFFKHEKYSALALCETDAQPLATVPPVALVIPD